MSQRIFNINSNINKIAKNISCFFGRPYFSDLQRQSQYWANIYVTHVCSTFLRHPVCCIWCLCYFSAYADEGKLVETESIANVFLIGINRPEKRNCVNQATAQQLCDAFRHFETDEELRVAVLYGKGLLQSRYLYI